jgi:hypothetical protein
MFLKVVAFLEHNFLQTLGYCTNSAVISNLLLDCKQRQYSLSSRYNLLIRYSINPDHLYVSLPDTMVPQLLNLAPSHQWHPKRPPVNIYPSVFKYFHPTVNFSLAHKLLPHLIVVLILTSLLFLPPDLSNRPKFHFPSLVNSLT